MTRKHPLLPRHFASGCDRLCVAHLHISIHVLGPDHLQMRHRIPATLNSMAVVGERSARQNCGALRLDDETARRRVGILEGCGTARKRPARADEVAEQIYRVRRLRQDLRTGVEIMRTKISRQPELVSTESEAFPDDPRGRLFYALQVRARDLPRDGIW